MPALNEQLALEGAKSIVQAALPSLLETVKNAMTDPALAQIDFQNKTPEAVVFAVAIGGSPIQRAALARHMKPEVGFSFPGIWSIANSSPTNLKLTIEFISNSLKSLAAHYGVSFQGDFDSVAYTISQDFGSLSFADFLMFFEGAKSGKYRQEYQHVAARGINYDFLQTWLTEYTEDRDAARQAVYQQYREPIRSADGGGISETDFRRLQAEAQQRKAARMLKEEERRLLEKQADDFRHTWEQEIFETQILRQWFKSAEIELSELDDKTGEVRKIKRTREILCDQSDSEKTRFEEYPIKAHRAGGVQRLMKRALYEYVTFGKGAPALELFAELQAIIRAKYKNEPSADYETAEMKTLIGLIYQLRGNLRVPTILETHITKIHPDATDDQIQATRRQIMEEIERLYYEEYLPDCIERSYPALRRNEFFWQTALFMFVEAGNENPVKKLIFE